MEQVAPKPVVIKSDHRLTCGPRFMIRSYAVGELAELSILDQHVLE